MVTAFNPISRPQITVAQRSTATLILAESSVSEEGAHTCEWPNDVGEDSSPWHVTARLDAEAFSEGESKLVYAVCSSRLTVVGARTHTHHTDVDEQYIVCSKTFQKHW